MTRGDLVTVAFPGDFAKPRPALVIQADAFAETGTLTVLLLTTTLADAPLIRPTVEPSTGNGLRQTSQVMVDKAVSVRRDRIGPVFGRLEPEALVEVSRALAVFLGIA